MIAGHPRRTEVRARLVELDSRNVAAACEAVGDLRLDWNVEIVRGDASLTDAYAGAVPADLIVLCGVLGLVSRDDARAIVTALPGLCAPGAAVVWTRQRILPDLIPDVRRWFAEAGFREEAFESPGPEVAWIGLHRLAVAPRPLVRGMRLFNSSVQSTWRFVMRRVLSAGLAVAVLGLVVALAASAGAQSQGRYGGTLVVGLSIGEPDALDPTTARTLSAKEIFNAICRGLYRVDADQQYVPDLATSMPVISKDKLTYTVTLRKGVLFNDGTPFDAPAVVTSFQRHMTLPGSRWTSNLSYLDSVTASGPYTVVFHLKARYSPLPYVISLPIMSPAQLTKLGANFSSDPVCVGPFMFDNRVAGDSVTAIKSPYYYGKYAVHFDKIVWKFLSGTPAAQALQAGDIQVLTSVAPTDLASLQHTAGVGIVSQPSRQRDLLYLNLGNASGVGNLPYTGVHSPLASSPKLRQAFEEAIDRVTVNKVANLGLEHPDCSWIPSSDPVWYASTEVPCTSYDPADAKKLVAASGIPNPTVHLLTSGPSNIPQVIQSEEAAVGINVVIDSTDLPTQVARLISGNYDVASGGTVAGNLDPGPTYQTAFGTIGTTNYSGYSNPRLDFVLANGFKATTLQARSTLYRVAERIIQADRPVIVLDDAVTYGAYSSSIQLGSTTFLDYVFGQYR